MRAPRSAFRRTEVFLLLLAFPLLTAGCGARKLWGTPEDELRSQLARGDYSALAKVDFTTQDPGESLDLSPSAPYYLSFAFDALDRPQEAFQLLDTAWHRSPSPWREEAGLLLARRSIERKDYAAAAEVARKIEGSSAPEETRQRARRLLVEALYWDKQDADALKEADGLTAPDAEVLLFRAVSSLRLGLPQGPELTLQLFLHERASSLHTRVYSWLAASPAVMQKFGQQDQDLLAGKDALAQAQWDRGISLLEPVAATLDSTLLEDGVLVSDLGTAYAAAGRAATGALVMERLAARLTGQAHADAEELAGRLHRRAREYPAALSWLRAAAADAPSAAQKDRVRLAILEVLFVVAPDDLPARVKEEASSWANPSAFSGLLQERIAELVSARRWKTLEGLWSALEDAGPSEVRAQLSYLLAREWQEGVIRRLPTGPTSAAGPTAVTARALFQDAEYRDPMGYYGILAASMLGDLPDRTVPAAPTDAGAAPPLDPVALGFLPFGLTAPAYARLWATRDSLDDAGMREAAQTFAQAGDYRSSMNFIGAVARARRLSAEELDLYYPRAFSAIIEPLAAQAGIPDHLLYGLVREESYFDPRVVSSAGAVGLSQLMPSTAADMAQRLRIVDPDLRDPSTNLSLGVRHFRDLVRSAGTITKALLAYNAGLSRIRQWERANPGVPADLFVESATIAETRDYVKKIFVSSVMYAFLYHDADPREAALSFFSLTPKALEQRGVR
ncbi:MAG TPA: lytic transglycosylase domain-containing protein [Spirochaetia bacterium]|nr:lytic transglycosylase domain-containing protein [Spirochaetia bacterium]